VPVFGWIVLRGRCRTCHLPISPRYPLVEFTAGCLLLVLAVLEVLLAGVNLPTFDAHGHAIMGLRWFVAHPRWDLVATGGYHAFLLCNLLSWALIEHDGHAIPKRLVMLAVAVAVLAPVACPWVQPILWMAEKPVWIAQQPWLNRVDTSLVGLAAGHVVGWAASLSSIPRDTFQSRTWDLRLGVMAGFSVVGAALGWQALLSVALVASGLRLAVSARRRQDMHRSSPTLMLLCLGLATLVQVCFWRGLDGWAWWPGSHATALAAIIAVLMLAELLWLGGVLDRRTLALLERGQGEVMETLAPLGRGQGEGASVAPDTDRAFQQPHQAEHSGQQNQAEEQ
jgi:leader peptidase (prepilin peptidase)/N-methyltransferase